MTHAMKTLGVSFTFTPIYHYDMNNAPRNRILLVDDEEDITTTFKAMLEEKGFKVDIFNSPLLALEKFSAGLYDLLLLDIRMPKMDGFKLYEELNKIDEQVKVVFITAFDINYAAMRALFPDLGMDCFIRKPIDSERLANTLRHELEK